MAVIQLRPKVGQMMFREFLEAGIPIFPLYRFKTNGQCECGDTDCEAVGKHPFPSSWQHSPLWEDDQVDGMEESGRFDTGYGVLCRGLLVVDVDARNGGVESYRKLLEAVPEVAGAGLAVQTGSGGGSQHLYFKAPADISLVTSLPSYPGIDFKSSGYVVGPGSSHKSGGIYTADGEPDDIGPAPAALLDLLKRPERHRSEYDGHAVDVSHADIGDMLSCIPNNDLPYDEWVSVGMAIHHATQGSGYALWEDWSASSVKHDGARMLRKWDSFGKSSNPVTLGSLIYRAQKGGWIMPVSFVPSRQFNEDAPRADGLPFDISGVDLTEPPGFVGDVARWIENQSFRPRRHIAVAGALIAIGNIAGLRYIDDLSNVTTNLFTFCVAGARTGKESVQQAVIALHRAAGIAAATHGGIKSEQEVTRNLIRHQAAFYVVDEFGIFLNKVRNSQKKGGAAYLDGVLGILMSAYSKAHSYLLLTGDAKEEVRSQLLREMATLLKVMEDKPSSKIEKRITGIERALDRLDQGLEKPFLSLMGFTTPVTFNDLVDHETATNGFIGRLLIFNERETVPRAKADFKPEPMPEAMSNYIMAIGADGEFDMMAPSRVENYEDRTVVPTLPRAAAMLAQVSEWMEVQAEGQKMTGLESLYLGAYELVSKVSLILAVPERMRTEEHVRWAFTLVRRDIEEKTRLVIGNETHKAFKGDALEAKVLEAVAGDGETEGVIVNRLVRKDFRREDVVALLERLQGRGMVQLVETVHARNKTATRRWVSG
jgi:hypothetical protein